MREYWGMSLRFMLVVVLVCASSVAHADFVSMQMDDEYQGVTLRLTDFAELQPSMLDSPFPTRPEGDPVFDPRSVRPPRERFASVFMPDWDTYAASYSGRQIDGIDLTSLLADAPAMFGHFYGGGIQFLGGSEELRVRYLPLAARSGRTHVGENNKALTQDRVYLRYNHFHRPSTASVATFPYGEIGKDAQDFHIDSYTLGAEKTFCDGIWSLEVRMPVAGQMHFSSFQSSVTGGNLGNLAVIAKRLIYLTNRSSAVAGLGVDFPTGSGVRGTLRFGEHYMVKNDAVHLLPFLGFLHASENRLFANGFIQLDLPLNGQRVFTGIWGEFSELGKFNEQTLLHLDLSVGRWLMRDPGARVFTGLAFLTELHYTTTLNDSDALEQREPGRTFMFFESPADRTDLLNLTIGLHTEWRNNTLLRVGSVFPLRTGTDRTFDSELQVQLERRF